MECYTVVDIYVNHLKKVDSPCLEKNISDLQVAFDHVHGYPLMFMKQALEYLLLHLEKKQTMEPKVREAIYTTVLEVYNCPVEKDCLWHIHNDRVCCIHEHPNTTQLAFAGDMFRGVYNALEFDHEYAGKFMTCWFTMFVAVCVQMCEHDREDLVWELIETQSEAFLRAYGNHPALFADTSLLRFSHDIATSRSDFMVMHHLCMLAASQTTMSRRFPPFLKMMFCESLAPMVMPYVLVSAAILNIGIEPIRTCKQCECVATHYGDTYGEYFCHLHSPSFRSSSISVHLSSGKLKQQHQLWGVYVLRLLKQFQTRVSYKETALPAACQLVLNYAMLNLEKFTTPDMSNILTSIYFMQAQREAVQLQQPSTSVSAPSTVPVFSEFPAPPLPQEQPMPEFTFQYASMENDDVDSLDGMSFDFLEGEDSLLF